MDLSSKLRWLSGPLVGSGRCHRWLPLLGLGLLVFGARLVLIQNLANDLPYMDQWDAEARQLFVPFREGGDWWSALWAPHNEHRIVGTRFLALGLLWANGQWDPLLEMTVNAAICAVWFMVLGALGWWLPALARSVWWTVLVGFGAAPYGWENTLFGFQSHVYLMQLFGAVALALAFRARGPSACLGATTLALVSALSGAGGFLLAAPFALMALQELRARRWTGSVWWVGAVAVLVFVAIGLRNQVPGHAMLQSNDYASFVVVFLSYLSWPLPPQGLWPVVMILPFLLLGVRVLRQADWRALDMFPLGLAAWGVAMAAVLAWSRGTPVLFGSGVFSRYSEMVVIIPLASVLSALVLCRAATGQWRRLALGSAGAWAAVVVAAVVAGGYGERAQLVVQRMVDRHVSARLLTRALYQSDVAVIVAAAAEARTYPDAAALWSYLNSPVLSVVLPPSLQRPLFQGWLDAGGRDRSVLIDGARVPTAWPMYSSMERSVPNRAESVTSSSFSVANGGVLFDVWVSYGAAGQISVVAEDGAWRQTWSLAEFQPNEWTEVLQTLPSGPMRFEVVTEDPSGGVLISAPRWIASGSVFVRGVVANGSSFVLGGAGILVFALLWGAGRASSAVSGFASRLEPLDCPLSTPNP